MTAGQVLLLAGFSIGVVMLALGAWIGAGGER